MKNILSEENLQNLLINYATLISDEIVSGKYKINYKVAMTEYVYDKVLGYKYNLEPEVKSFIIKLFIKNFDDNIKLSIRNIVSFKCDKLVVFDGEYVFAKS